MKIPTERFDMFISFFKSALGMIVALSWTEVVSFFVNNFFGKNDGAAITVLIIYAALATTFSIMFVTFLHQYKEKLATRKEVSNQANQENPPTVNPN